jgi:hypothetical protein
MPLAPSALPASVISTLTTALLGWPQNQKGSVMKKGAKIESINIRRSHLGLTAIVYSEGYIYAVRYAPDTVVTMELVRKSWREQRGAFRPYNDSTDMFL